MNNLDKEIRVLEQEELIDFIKSLSPEYRSKYMQKLAIRMRLDKAKLQDLKNKQKLLENTQFYGDMTAEGFTRHFFEYLVAGLVAGGVSSGLLGNSLLSDVDQASLIVPVIVGGSIVGGVGGILMNLIDCNMNASRPVSNAINDVRKYFNTKKIKRLESKIEADNIVSKGVNGFSETTDLEDEYVCD